MDWFVLASFLRMARSMIAKSSPSPVREENINAQTIPVLMSLSNARFHPDLDLGF